MKKNEIEKALNNLLKSAAITKKAMAESTSLEDKIRFQMLSKTIESIRNSIIPLTLDFEDAIQKIDYGNKKTA